MPVVILSSHLELCLPIRMIEYFVKVANSGAHDWDHNVSVYDNRELLLGPYSGVRPIPYEVESAGLFHCVFRNNVTPCRLCQLNCPDIICFGRQLR